MLSYYIVLSEWESALFEIWKNIKYKNLLYNDLFEIIEQYNKYGAQNTNIEDKQAASWCDRICIEFVI